MNIFSIKKSSNINVNKSSSKLHLNYLQSPMMIKSPQQPTHTNIHQSARCNVKTKQSELKPDKNSSSNRKPRNKSDSRTKPVIPPKPSNLLINNRLSRHVTGDKKRGHEEKKPRKGNSLPIMSSSMCRDDRTTKSFSLDCVVDRVSEQSLFQRFMKEASMGVKRSVRKVENSESDSRMQITPHTVSRHSTFFPNISNNNTRDTNGKKRFVISAGVTCPSVILKYF